MIQVLGKAVLGHTGRASARTRGAELHRKIARCQQIHRDAKQLFQRDRQAAEIKQRRHGQWVYQEIEIAFITVVTANDRPEHPWIGRLETHHHFTHGIAVRS
jgi:hypothetical protein